MTGEIQLVETLKALPGSCRGCGGSDKKWYIDMGYSEEFHGAVYYCNECLAFVASLAGFATPEVVENLRKQIDHLETELFDMKTRNEGLEQAIAGLHLAGYGGGSTPLHPDLFPADSSSAEPSPGEGAVGTGAGADAEPLHDEGLGELRSDDDSDGNEFTLFGD